MKNYLLVIYDEELSEEDISTLSGLCDDMRIEKISDETSDLLAESYKLKFGFICIGYCYRFYREEMLPSMFLLKEHPTYIGQFDAVSEQRCIELGVLCQNACSLKEMTEGIGGMALKHSDAFKKAYGRDGDLNWEEAKRVEDTTWNDYQLIEGELNYFFEQRRLH